MLPLHCLAQLEPGEVVTDESGASASPTAAALQLAETAAGAAVARCDAIQSRKARSIVKEVSKGSTARGWLIQSVYATSFVTAPILALIIAPTICARALR
jgi:hypothetical protein